MYIPDLARSADTDRMSESSREDEASLPPACPGSTDLDRSLERLSRSLSVRKKFLLFRGLLRACWLSDWCQREELRQTIISGMSEWCGLGQLFCSNFFIILSYDINFYNTGFYLLTNQIGVYSVQNFTRLGISWQPNMCSVERYLFKKVILGNI